MINITFTHPDTNLDEVWPLLVKEHSPLIEKRDVAIANAGDYVDPEVHYKGSYETTTLESWHLPASDINKFYLFRRATKRGRVFVVEGSAVMLVGFDYTAIRTGDLKPIALNSDRHFKFTLNMRVVGVL